MTDLQIRYFLEVSECLNFTEAARRFFIAQPTLSKQIALLEEELGVQLFFRNNRRVQLTAAGQFLRSEFSILAQEKENVIQQAKQIGDGAAGRLVVGVQDILWNSRLVSRLLSEFHALHPEIQYALRVYVYQPLLEELQAEHLDVILSKQFGEGGFPGLRAVKLASNPSALLVHKDNPLAQREEVELQELKDERFIVLGQNAARFSDASLISACQQVGFYPNIACFANCNLARILYVELGMGVTLMDMNTVLSEQGNVRMVRLKETGLEQTSTFAISKKNVSNPKVETFFQYIKDAAPLKC